nr:HemK/PrmC family methyltransferase [Lacticaseibacillus thailandensis]
MSRSYGEALRAAERLLSSHQVEPDGATYVLTTRLNWTRSRLILHARDVIPQAVDDQLQRDLAQLLDNVPPQYVVGRAPFFDHWFHVTPAVLIPRFETEELVSWVLSDQRDAQSGLDLGTGSGAIGITLAKRLPRVRMTLSDVSVDALAVSRENARTLGADVQLVQSDMFTDIPARFDFVVANLPYISHDEEKVMDASTLAYEPHLALFADNHGLALFQHFFLAPSPTMYGGVGRLT